LTDISTTTFGMAGSGSSIAVITIAGELDRVGVAALRNAVFTPSTVAAALLIVDMSAVDFLDSSGIGALVAARRWTNSHNTRLTLVCPLGAAHRTLEIVGLDSVFTIHPTIAHALSDEPVDPSPPRLA
jgi:anti-sigma B factor antagonist